MSALDYPTYNTIGIRPLINCKGTLTMYSGSVMLPEVREAMIEASRSYVHIEELIELRKNTGDDRRRTHDMNTANWVPDLFMKRVEADEDWSLFCPNEAKHLSDLCCKDFDSCAILPNCLDRPVSSFMLRLTVILSNQSSVSLRV